MSPLKARNRLVSFRVTQDELESLRVACLVQGARNVSEFARGAVLQLAETRVHPEAQLLDRLSVLELRLAEIEGSLRHHSEMLRALLKGVVAERAKGV
jgi:hypothetical protein